jgi:hypothetical protein
MSRDQDEILLGGVDSDLADRYRTAKQKVRERTGVNLSIAGGGRSRERQQKYFEEGKTPYDGSNPNAPHPLGLALDLNWKRLPSNIQSVAAEELRNVGLRQGGRLANGYSEKHHWQLPAVTDGNHVITGLDGGSSQTRQAPTPQTISDGNIEVDFSPQIDSTPQPTRRNEVTVPTNQTVDVSTLQAEKPKTPKITSAVNENADFSDESGPIKGAKPIEFKPENPSFMQRAAMGGQALAGVEQLPANHPDSWGQQLTAVFSSPGRQPTQDQLADSMLQAIGPQAVEVGRRYKNETGRSILEPDVNQDKILAYYDPASKAYKIPFNPTQKVIRTLNAYAQGGLSAVRSEVAKMDTEGRNLTAQQEKDRIQAEAGKWVNPDLSSAYVNAVAPSVKRGVAEASLGSAKLVNNLSGLVRDPNATAEDALALQGAQASIPKETTLAGKVVRGVASGGVTIPRYIGEGAVNPVLPVLDAYSSNLDRGPEAAVTEAEQFALVGGVGHATGGALEGANPIVRQIGARTSAGLTNAGLAYSGGERDPGNLVAEGIVGASLPVGKARGEEPFASTRPLADAPETPSMVRERAAQERLSSPIADQMKAKGQAPLETPSREAQISPEQSLPADATPNTPETAPEAETPHYSNFQPRYQRGEKAGQFKKGSPEIPDATTENQQTEQGTDELLRNAATGNDIPVEVQGEQSGGGDSGGADTARNVLQNAGQAEGIGSIPPRIEQPAEISADPSEVPSNWIAVAPNEKGPDGSTNGFHRVFDSNGDLLAYGDSRVGAFNQALEDEGIVPNATARTPVVEPPTLTPIEQAFKDWNGKRAYVDARGNYHVRGDGKTNGPIAPWNKEVRAQFKDSAEFHRAARQSQTQESLPPAPSPSAQTQGEVNEPIPIGTRSDIPVGDGGRTAPRGGDNGAGLEESPTGPKVAVTRQEREARGLSPVEQQAYQTMGASYEAGKDSVERGTIDPRTLAEQVAKTPRNLSATETGALGYDRARLLNAHDAVMSEIEKAMAGKDDVRAAEGRARLSDIERQLDNNDTALELAGREWSMAGQARKAMIRKDYSLAEMVRRYKVETGKEPSAEVRATIEKQAAQIKDLQAKIDAHEAEKQRQSEEEAVNRAKEDIKREQRRAKRATTKGDIDKEWIEIKIDLKNALKDVGKVKASGLAGLDPEGNLTKAVARMVKNRVKAGVTTLDGIVDEVYSAIKEHVDDITKRDVRDLISGYGKTAEMSQDEASKTLRDLKRQARLISAIEDAESRQRPARSGLQREPESPRVKKLREQLADELKKQGISVERDPNPAAKKRLESQISDIERQLEQKGKEIRASKGRSTMMLKRRRYKLSVMPSRNS